MNVLVLLDFVDDHTAFRVQTEQNTYRFRDPMQQCKRLAQEALTFRVLSDTLPYVRSKQVKEHYHALEAAAAVQERDLLICHRCGAPTLVLPHWPHEAQRVAFCLAQTCVLTDDCDSALELRGDRLRLPLLP